MAIFIPSREFKVKTTLDAPINLNPVRLSKFLISEDFMLTEFLESIVMGAWAGPCPATGWTTSLPMLDVAAASLLPLPEKKDDGWGATGINMDDREWMYRHMRSGHLNPEFIVGKKVTNKAQVEGSICDAYWIDEITNFTSYYFGDDVQTIWNRVP
ncbi:hypothetical protein SADUNF_Sadunf06G0137000 [Salix dunnii]|uniref:DUF4218 domain-containing protein n=1 Tax=Salix dunnii TaxID=1413687 RepID=A0A835MXI8_9ROSI|nr:hypothetical protein SADUNF_Sadunf06G0137000 [Salix dunnii]